MMTAELICVFVLAYAKCWFSHDVAQIILISICIRLICEYSRYQPMVKAQWWSIFDENRKMFCQFSFKLLRCECWEGIPTIYVCVLMDNKSNLAWIFIQNVTYPLHNCEVGTHILNKLAILSCSFQEKTTYLTEVAVPHPWTPHTIRWALNVIYNLCTVHSCMS